MRRLSSQQAFHILGLPQTATSHQVHTAFRRLAKRYHPDVCGDTSDHRLFARMVEAYRVLRRRLGRDAGDVRDERCPRCGAHADLFRLLDGRLGCADCLFGRTQRRHLLTGPVRVVVRHISVFLLYGLGAALMARYFRTEDLTAALLALGAVWLGFGVLAVQVLTTVFDAAGYRRAIRGREIADPPPA